MDDLNLTGRVEFSVVTVAENGYRSEKCHYAITNALSALEEDSSCADASQFFKVVTHTYCSGWCVSNMFFKVVRTFSI